MNNIKFIIPCVGAGTRMNMEFNKSKELISDPFNDNKPLIQWWLDKLKEYNHPILIITRKEKTDLIEYVSNIENIELLILEEITNEWPETILKSSEKWSDTNVLILPDTRLNPISSINHLIEKMNDNQIGFCLHEVDDIRLWGKVLLDPFSNKPLSTQEKSDIKFQLKGNAWGILSFKKEIGEKLFQAYLDRRVFSLSKIKTCVIKLDSFKDITRTGQLESY